MSGRALLQLVRAGLWHGERARTLGAIGGAALGIFAVVLHLGFLRGVAEKSTAFYDLFRFDAVVVARGFQFFYDMPDFPAGRAIQVRSTPGVSGVSEVRLTSARWRDPDTDRVSSLTLGAVEKKPGFVADPALNAAMDTLVRHRDVIVDRRSASDYGSLISGRHVAIGAQSARIAATFDAGLRLYADGFALVAPADFPLFAQTGSEQVHMLLVQIDPARRPEAMAALQRLPDDVRVILREDLRRDERAYFIRVKPLGALMALGMVVGALVAVVALYQALASYAESRQPQLAALRAMGFGRPFTMGVGLLQALALALLALLVAALAVVPVLLWVRAQTMFDVLPGVGEWLLTAGAVLMVATACAATVLGALHRVDPAELFG